jgi:hypothetical protein
MINSQVEISLVQCSSEIAQKIAKPFENRGSGYLKYGIF